MSCTVFYSWQSDLPNSTNRSFIENALREAVRAIHDDESIRVEPVLDRDTTGVPGSPDIANTIFTKIEQAQVFVCDVSIINTEANQQSGVRATPNPNVLIELGYAIKALGSSRIIMLMNTAYGGPELLPFDLRMRRVTPYTMQAESGERATGRKRLAGSLTVALRTIFGEIEAQSAGAVTSEPSISEQARIAVESSQPNQAFLIQKYMQNLVQQLDSLSPDFSTSIIPDELLVQSINQTAEIVLEFARLAETISGMSAREAAIAVYEGFEEILKRYYQRPDYRGAMRNTDFDFYRFIGHELFVTFFAFLIRQRQWNIITELLQTAFYVDNARGRDPGAVPFTYVYQPVRLLIERGNRLQLNRVSLQADMLYERHTTGELADVVPIQAFMDADCFLFLRSEISHPEPISTQGFSWAPWSSIYMERPPKFLVEAVQVSVAQKLLQPLGAANVEALRSLIAERAPKLASLSSSIFNDEVLGGFDVLTIGTR